MKIGVLRTYRWVDKDPLCDVIRSALEETGLNKNQVSELSGVASGTLKGWLDGATRRPQNSTSTAVLAALGCVRRDHLNRDGTVTPGYERVRDYDWRKELDRAADFWVKQNTARGRRKKTKRAKRRQHVDDQKPPPSRDDGFRQGERRT